VKCHALSDAIILIRTLSESILGVCHKYVQLFGKSETILFHVFHEFVEYSILIGLLDSAIESEIFAEFQFIVIQVQIEP